MAKEVLSDGNKLLIDTLIELKALVLPRPHIDDEPVKPRAIVEFSLRGFQQAADKIAAVLVKMIAQQKIEFSYVAGLPPREFGEPRVGDDLAWAVARSRKGAFPTPIYFTTASIAAEEEGGAAAEDSAPEQKIVRVIDPLVGTEKLGPVLVVDALTGKGGRAKEGVEALRAAGFKVNDVVTFIDRLRNARPTLNDLNVRLHPVMDLELVIEYLHSCKLVHVEPNHLFLPEHLTWKL